MHQLQRGGRPDVRVRVNRRRTRHSLTAELRSNHSLHAEPAGLLDTGHSLRLFELWLLRTRRRHCIQLYRRRAVFAPDPGFAGWQSNHDFTCQAYKSAAASMASAGYQTASLQSYVSNDGTRRYQATWVKW